MALYKLRAQTVSAKVNTWLTEAASSVDANLVISSFARSDSKYINDQIFGIVHESTIQFTVKYYLDGSVSVTEIADLPSGFKITTAIVVTALLDTCPANCRAFVHFSAAHESASFISAGDHSFVYPTTIPNPSELLAEGIGLKYQDDTVLHISGPRFDLVEVGGFYSISAPTVTDVSPSTGPISGKAVTITGTNFSTGTGMAVTFDGVAATSVVVVSDTQITCVAPAHIIGAVTVTATSLGSGTPQSGSLVAGFTYVAPAITSIAPSEGSFLGGLAVTLTGTNFGTAINAVTIGGTAATSVVRVSETTITCVTPAHVTPGAVDVVVTDPNDPASPGTLLGGFTYIAYFNASGDIDDILPDQKAAPADLNWYTYRVSAAGWSTAAEPPKKGWWFTNATTVAAFTSRGNTYLTVDV